MIDRPDIEAGAAGAARHREREGDDKNDHSLPPALSH
jgi:hypothetical protein